MFYEKERSPAESYFHRQQGESLNFSRHLHRSFEFIDVVDGEMTLLVRYGSDEVSFAVTPGHSALILPYQIHSYKTEKHASYYMSIFSVDFVRTFYDMVKNRTSASPIFTLSDGGISRRLYETPDEDILAMKSSLYAVCSDFHRQAELHEHEKSNIGLLDRIFSYIENHYTENITLKQIADELNYNYHYISNFFNSQIGINFKRFLNEYRIHQACERLRGQNESITETAHHSGYDTLRSFNREFLNITGLTPSEYKKQS
ncbi:MAG: AraC family transcriptional regulator [Eubacteriales bacterium]